MMTNRNSRTYLLRAFLVLILTALALTVMSLSVSYAATAPDGSYEPGVVYPSGEKSRADIYSVKDAMAESDTITFLKGETYYLAWPIHIVSGKTINANGATIICEKGAIDQQSLRSAGYSNIKNVTINGGTWKYKTASGYTGTSFGFVHGYNINLKNMTLKNTNYNGHAIEFVACKKVLMDNVKVIPLGKKKKSLEAMVQIDIATKATYPRLKENAKLANGATCSNVIIKNCDITGNRALATGYAYKDKKYLNKCHKAVTIKNNKLTSYNAEGIFLPNTKKATITGNTIISKCSKTSVVKSAGLHILQVGKIKKSTFTVKNNTIKGGLCAIRAWSESKIKIAKVTMKGNKFYCKKGKKKAINVNKHGTKKIVNSKNKTYKW